MEAYLTLGAEFGFRQSTIFECSREMWRVLTEIWNRKQKNDDDQVTISMHNEEA